jgi:hypothetical protein
MQFWNFKITTYKIFKCWLLSLEINESRLDKYVVQAHLQPAVDIIA